MAAKGGCVLTPFKRRVQRGIQSCDGVDLEQPPGGMDAQKEGIRGSVPSWVRGTWRTAGGERRRGERRQPNQQRIRSLRPFRSTSRPVWPTKM